VIKTMQISCDLCGSGEYRFLFSARDRLHGSDGSFSYVICRSCGLVYMNPQPLPNEMYKFYPSDYAPYEAKAESQEFDRHTVKRRLRRRPFMTLLCSRLSKGSRLLDVGCGNGDFLSEIKRLTNCRVYGVDISETAAKTVQQNHGINIFIGAVTEAPFPDNFFDVITAWSYLEHVHNPSKVLLRISRILKDDGLCIISTPNFNSINAKLFKAKWYHLDCPRHLYLYTPQTITALLEKSGMSVKKIAYSKTSKGVLGSLQYCIYGDNYNRRYRNKIRRSSLLKKIVSPWTRIAALARQSDIMNIHAVRVE